MRNVHEGPWKAKNIRSSSSNSSGALDNTGGPPDDPRMEERVKKLEDLAEQSRTELRTIDTRLTKIETRLDVFATKADVAEAKNSIIMWVVSAILFAQVLPPLLKKIGL